MHRMKTMVKDRYCVSGNLLRKTGGFNDGFFNGVDVSYINESKISLKVGCIHKIPEGKDDSFLLEIIDGLVAGILDGLLLGFDVSLTVVSDDGFMNGLYFIGVCEID